MNTVKRVRELLDERGMSLYQAARVSGVSYSTVATAARRGNQLSVDTIDRLCGVMEISLADFFQEPGERRKPIAFEQETAEYLSTGA